MNVKISMFVICVEAIIYLLLYNLRAVPSTGLNIVFIGTYIFYF